MAWCPVCKNEYREGITECSECKVPLVDNLEDCELVKILYGTREGLEELKDYLEYNAVKPVQIDFDKEEGTEALFVSEKDKLHSIKLISTLMKQKQLEQLEANKEMEFTDVKPQDTSAMLGFSDYTSNAKKAEDNKSAAYALLGVGVLGIVFVVLGFLDVLPFHPGNRYLLYGVLGAMFALFFVMGCISLKNAKGFEKKAITENTLTDTIKEWCVANLTKDVIDSSFQTAGKSEEELYFYRASFMKKRLNTQFMNLDQAFIENFIDDVLYDLVFGEQEA